MIDVEIVGLMYVWGVSIDSVSVTNLVLAVGLAVLHGAASTFCAVMLLSMAGSYIFIVFFKMFFAICLFGVINGLILLPIVLSLIGPGQLSITPPRMPDEP